MRDPHNGSIIYHDPVLVDLLETCSHLEQAQVLLKKFGIIKKVSSKIDLFFVLSLPDAD